MNEVFVCFDNESLFTRQNAIGARLLSPFQDRLRMFTGDQRVLLVIELGPSSMGEVFH